jgi:AbrB family looped-hinge helix DNA binding protein
MRTFSLFRFVGAGMVAARRDRVLEFPLLSLEYYAYPIGTTIGRTAGLDQEVAVNELLTVVTRKGQITVPAEIRRLLEIREGDKMALSVRDLATREVRLRPVKSVSDITFGSIAPRKRPEDLRELRRAYEEDVAAEVAVEGTPELKGRPSTNTSGRNGRTRRVR